MKIGVQTLNNKKYSIDIDEKETVAQLKAKIHAEHALGEPEEQKLIHLGKILKNEQTIESAAIKPGAMIVLMISKIKKPATATDGSSSSGAAATTATPPVAATPATTAPATTTPTATPAESTAVPVTNAPATTTPATTTPSGTPSTPATANAAASALALGANLEPMIADLMALGFPRDQVQAALRASFNNPDRAADYLFNGIPDSVMRDLNRPPPPSAGANAGGGAPAQPAQATPPRPAQPPQAPMGGGGGAGGLPSDVDPNNPLAGLAASPQFAQMRAMLQANPQLIPVILQQLAQSNPEIAQLIAQNPEALADLLSGGGGGGGGDPTGGAGGRRGNQQVIQITMEEKQQLDNLEALGFSRQRALQAWLLCDRNEELAANYLFDHGHDDEDMGGGGGGSAGGAGGQSGGGGAGGGFAE